MLRYRRFAVAAALTALLVAASTGAFADVRALPALSLTTLDGASVAREIVARPGRWLLVYLLPQSAACRALVGQLEPLSVSAGARIVVIAGPDAAQATALVQAHPALASATVLLDPSNVSFQVLGLKGVPMVFGMRDTAIQWTLGGTLTDARTVASILETWLR